MADEDIVFISYAREDREWAERLYMDLRKQQVNAWLDVRCLTAGSHWKREIRGAIRRARYFILLLSKHSVGKRGFVQHELKEAIDTMREIPTGEIFLIPARLDRTEPVDEELQNLNWVDLVPSYHDGLARILSAIATAKPAPLIVSGDLDGPAGGIRVVDRGREIDVPVPLMIGERAAIRYAPFRTAKEFLQQFMDRLPTDSQFADSALSYYITFDTRHPKATLSEGIRARFPEHITIVLQMAFHQLQVREEGISIVLTFGGVAQTVAIPYEAIRVIRVPEVGLTIHLEDPRGS